MHHPSYLDFWGKARGPLPDDPLTWHPLAYHCLDVAAVADELLRQSPRRLAAMARLAGTQDVDGFRKFLVALIALHDIGKFATSFQAKVEGAWPVALGPYPKNPKTNGDHALLASQARIVLGVKPALIGWNDGYHGAAFNSLWHAISGHHGLPKVGEPAKIAGDMQGAFPPAAVEAACAFRDDVLALFPDRAILPAPRPSDRRLAILSWAIAGLTVVADWIGSRRDWFPYEKPAYGLADYWPRAQCKAAAAVAMAGILPAAASSTLRIEHLLPENRCASPLQRAMADMPLPDGPSLTIVEDVTGSGKTEAALMLAARLVADGRAAGLFFALPTMATANAMYERMREPYRRIFATESAPSLVLAHGKRNLNDKFQSSILGVSETPPSVPAGDHEDDATAMCTAWLADDRRKALLAHVGVGTIDQALLGVLPSKFQSLRLWGMADRVLVLDEVHAFDAYMSREIETLLEFQAALGGSAILLSATLPARQRAALEAAFKHGLGVAAGASAAASDAPYPLVTVVSAAGTKLAPLETRADRTRSVPVRRIGTVQEAVAHIADIVAKGGCVAWIRNSVDDAIEAVDLVRAYDSTIEPVLLHARFAMGDRLEIERKVCATLGPGNNPGRVGYVLIGTQILEASLDYDVDAMITDLAPVDLIIQRAGRLWRHSDRSRCPVTKPELVILSAEPTQDADAKWYDAVSRRAPWVYRHHGIVWRSASRLFTEGTIATPGGVRGLVEAVYGPGRSDLDDVPKGLHDASLKAFGADMAAQTFAHGNLLKLTEGYAGQHNTWTPDTLTPTRLGDPVTVFRLGRWDRGQIVPYYGDTATPRNWALSEVSVNRRTATGTLPADAATDKAISAAKELWPKWERDIPLLVLTKSDAAWTGTVTKDDPAAIDVVYCSNTGFRLS